MPLLSRRVALVTGAGRGIGRSIGLAFAQEGAKVAVTARTTAELEEVVRAITARGGAAVGISADLSQRGDAARAIQETQAAFGPIDILVNNAGLGSSADPRPLVNFNDDFWDLSLAINLTAPYLLSKAVLPSMLERKWGRIIIVASINGKIGSFHGAAYAASKHGVLGLMRTMALETAGQGVTVNAICPGPVHTLMNDKRIAYDADRRGITLQQLEAGITPLGRRLEPDEIAPWAVYLAADSAAAVTGQAFNIDGGVLMAG